MKRNPQSRTPLAAPILVLALCALYLVFSVGVVKATHFCMGREASVAYFTAESKKCACSMLAEGYHCCDDKQDIVKLEDSQKTLSGLQLPLPALTFLGALYNASLQAQTELTTCFRPYSGDAQPPPKILFELNCSFVFYDTETIA